MNIFHVIALPIAVIGDFITLGQIGITDQVLHDARTDTMVKAQKNEIEPEGRGS